MSPSAILAQEKKGFTMRLIEKVVHVHDIWDGQLWAELQRMSLGLVIKTTKPGYNRLGLPDYISQHEPIAVIINTPLLGQAVTKMARKATKLPTLYITSQSLARKRALKLRPTERVLWRENLTGFALIGALHDCLAELPVHS